MFKHRKHQELPQIIEAIRYGDEHAYNVLIDMTYGQVLAYCKAFGSRHDAHDLAQETFLRAIKSKFASKTLTSVEGFLIYIAKCVCADYVKEQKKIRHINDQCMVHNDVAHHDILISDDHGVGSLSQDLREAFVLTQLLNFSYEETSEICDVSTGTIKSRVSRAKEKLRAASTLKQA